MSYTLKHQTLVRNLIEKTNSNKIKWEESSLRDAFQVSFPDYSLVISLEPSQQVGADVDVVISIYNSDGVVVDSLSDVTIKDGSGSEWFIAMKALYESARRKALGADQALDDILKSLGEARD